jgi:mono/diheme cytochrome c family protein
MRSKTAFAFSGLAILLILGCQNNPYKQGRTLYNFHCAGCHMEDGSGLAKLIPHLDGSVHGLKDPNTLICLIRSGLPVNPATGQKMPPNPTLSEAEIANLVNFLGKQYKSIPQWVKVDEATRMYAACQTN